MKFSQLKRENELLLAEVRHLHWCQSVIRDSLGKLREDENEVYKNEMVVFSHGLATGAVGRVEEMLRELEEREAAYQEEHRQRQRT